jgi:hypothetical protein
MDLHADDLWWSSAQSSTTGEASEAGGRLWDAWQGASVLGHDEQGSAHLVSSLMGLNAVCRATLAPFQPAAMQFQADQRADMFSALGTRLPVLRGADAALVQAGIAPLDSRAALLPVSLAAARFSLLVEAGSSDAECPDIALQASHLSSIDSSKPCAATVPAALAPPREEDNTHPDRVSWPDDVLRVEGADARVVADLAVALAALESLRVDRFG